MKLMTSFSMIFGCGLMWCQMACAQPVTKAVASQTSAATDWTQEKPGVPKGKVEAFTVPDKQYQYERKIWVYTPPGYQPKNASAYSLLVTFDGEDYLKDIPAPTILNNLLAAGKIAPTVQVMIDNSTDRLGDLANHQKFADFVARDLMPWVRQRFRVTTDARHTILCGYSAGGLAAAYVAFKSPQFFGNVLVQSGAFWRGNEGSSTPAEWLTEQYQQAAKQSLRFYLEVGGGEKQRNASGFSMIETSRHLRDVLKAKGYEVQYVEVPNALHNAEHWRAQLADGLIYLLGR